MSNPIIDKIVIIINALGLFFALGVNVYTTFIAKRELPTDLVEFMKLKEAMNSTTLVAPYKLEKILTNLYSERNKLKFIDMELHLVPFKQADEELFKKKTPEIYDSIIDVAMRMKKEEINTLSGKIIFEERVKKKINRFYGRAVVKNILFSKFVVQ